MIGLPITQKLFGVLPLIPIFGMLWALEGFVRFGREGSMRMAVWAGVAPGNHESAGKRRSGKTCHGNKSLRTALNQAAHAAARTKGCYLAAQYHRLAARGGCHRMRRTCRHFGRRVWNSGQRAQGPAKAGRISSGYQRRCRDTRHRARQRGGGSGTGRRRSHRLGRRRSDTQQQRRHYDCSPFISRNVVTADGCPRWQGDRRRRQISGSGRGCRS